MSDITIMNRAPFRPSVSELMYELIAVAGKIHYPYVAFIDITQAMIPCHEYDLALLFRIELLFQPMQLHAEIAEKMYEILRMDHKTEIPTVPSLFCDVWQIDMPAA